MKTDKRVGFTPGPWEISPSNVKQINDVDVVDSNGLLVAVPAGQPKENRRANAHLIASAPELLEACKQFLSYADNGKHPHLMAYANTIAGEKMRQAIAKAEGR